MTYNLNDTYDGGGVRRREVANNSHQENLEGDLVCNIVLHALPSLWAGYEEYSLLDLYSGFLDYSYPLGKSIT